MHIYFELKWIDDNEDENVDVDGENTGEVAEKWLWYRVIGKLNGIDERKQ